MGDRLIRVTGNEKQLEVSKFCANYLPETAKQQELERVLEPGYTVIHRGGDFMEIVPKGFNKATGIKEICRLLDIAHIRLGTVRMTLICCNIQRIRFVWAMGCSRPKMWRIM